MVTAAAAVAVVMPGTASVGSEIDAESMGRLDGRSMTGVVDGWVSKEERRDAEGSWCSSVVFDDAVAFWFTLWLSRRPVFALALSPTHCDLVLLPPIRRATSHARSAVPAQVRKSGPVAANYV